MRQEIKLFINEQEVWFSEPPQINFVYQKVDYTNPTIVKNSFTKTLEIEGVPQNNKIFNSIFLSDRINSNANDYFVPSKRVPFQLFENGDILEQGYCRLDNIRKDGAKITYFLTLFGGLGEFFYQLSYNESDNPDEGGEPLTLADLTYRTDEGEEIDFDFDINKETVKEAWDNLELYKGYISNKWDIVNFCPAYNGYPEFDADKVLVDVSGTTGIMLRQIADYQITPISGFPTTLSGETAYATPYRPLDNRFAFAECGQDMTEWETKDLRSYLQRPCLKVTGLFNGIANSTKFSLDLDKNFFAYDNPYWTDAYITLGQFSNLENESESASTTFTIGNTDIIDRYDNRLRLEGSTGLYESVSDVSITFTPKATYRKPHIDEHNEAENTATHSQFYPAYWTGGQGGGRYKYGALTCQLLGMDSDGEIVAGSDIYVCTNKVWKDGKWKSATLADMNFESVYGANAIYDYGYFKRGQRWTVLAWDCEWYKPITLTLSTNSKDIRYVTLRMCWINHRTDYRSSLSPTQGKPSYIFHTYAYSGVTPTISSSNITVQTPSDTHSGTRITKQKLLSGLDATPCELLLGYCKLFNLFFEKDLYEDIIHIRHRGNFYDGKLINLEKCIDRSKEINIKPLSFDSKWYQFKYSDGEDDSENLAKYLEERSNTFGQQKVDTGYNFDSSINDLLDGIAYKNGVSVQEQSPYFHYYRTTNTDNKGLPPFLFGGKVQYTLFRNDLMDDKSVEITYPAQAYEGTYTKYGQYFDAFDKLQLHTEDNEAADGSGVLCFFNGFNAFEDFDGEHPISGITGFNQPLTYRLTDDLQQMITLNGKPCWLYTNDDNLGIPITKVPHFSRYTRFRDSELKYIGMAWDFGFPAELYLPEKKYSTTSTIYNRFWKDYISDLYNVNTRVLECYVKMEGKVLGDWLKHFYWFDNCYWVLTKITDYCITSYDTVLCEFTKVNNKNAYTDVIAFSPILTLTPSYDGIIPATGMSMDVTVYISDSGSWGTDFDPSIITSCNPTRSSGGVETTVVHITIAPNDGVEREFTFKVSSTDNQKTITFRQAAGSTLGLNPTRLNFDYDANITKSLSVTATTNYNITITDN